MTLCIITLWHIDVMSLTMSMSTMHFLLKYSLLIILKVIISHFKGSYDKQNLTRVVISYKMTTRVRSSIYHFVSLAGVSFFIKGELEKL